MLSLWLYLAFLGIEATPTLKLLNTLTALSALYLLLLYDRITLFWYGAFTGLLWFYWIALSFRYYDVSYLMPLMWLFVAVGYGLIFWILGLFRPIPRAILFTFISALHPLNFNWFVPEIALIDSYFGIEKWQFLTLLLSLALFITLKNRWRYGALAGILLAINFQPLTPTPLPHQKIYLTDLHTPQNLKWEDSYRNTAIDINLATIKKAIDEGYDIVLLSESAFPLFLNQEPYLMQLLKALSEQITIVTGALYFDGKDSYNSTYYFQQGRVQIANKVVLVPFGEEIPLPRFISHYINKIIYDGAEDYIAAKKPVDIQIGDETFRNAICYEATREELFVGNPHFMLAISNNAWFTPSVEPTLQYQLLRYFSRRHHTTIFHSANMTKSGIIRK